MIICLTSCLRLGADPQNMVITAPDIFVIFLYIFLLFLYTEHKNLKIQEDRLCIRYGKT